MRYATVQDCEFISSLILKGAANGHFAPTALTSEGTRELELELKSVISNRRRQNGSFAYVLIWERNGRSIGFVAISALDGNSGNELWLAAVSPDYRRQGEGKKMIKTVLHQFKQNGVGLLARCTPESGAMFHILMANGFALDATLEKGTRQLVSRW